MSCIIDPKFQGDTERRGWHNFPPKVQESIIKYKDGVSRYPGGWRKGEDADALLVEKRS